MTVQYLSTNAKSAKKDEKALEILRARIATVSRALSISTKFGTFPNDSLAKTAARAAANQGSRQEANAAAVKCVDQFGKSSLILDVQLSQDFNYEKDKEVVVKTRMTVKLPAAPQGFDVLKFDAQAVAPVLAAPADV